MITFKSDSDLEKLNPSDPAYPLIRRLLNRLPEILPSYDPDADGYIVLIQRGDSVIDLPELNRPLAEIPWEGVTRQDGFFHGVYLCNNQFALEFVIPDADWVAGELRVSLEERGPEYLI